MSTNATTTSADSRTKKAWINLVALLVTVGVNTLGGLGMINGMSQKEISDMYLTLITPNSTTFSIWSVIYALLFISIIVMIVKKDDPYYREAVDQISPLFIITCILNIAWIVTFSYVLVEISLIFILALEIVLAMICVKLLAIREGRRWLLPTTFGLYGGWLFIATVVNAAAALVKNNWSGFGLAQETWGIIMLSVSILLLLIVMLRVKNAAYALPLAWAYFGIWQYLRSAEGFNGSYPTLEMVAIIGAGVLLVIAIIVFVRNRNSVLPAEASR